MTENKTVAEAKQPNPLLELLLNLLLPLLILSKWDGGALGPKGALVIALCLPIGYGIWDYFRTGEFNFLSALGALGVIATGLLGIFEAGAHWFAMKEAVMPLLVGGALLASHLGGKQPLIQKMFFQPALFATKRIDEAIEERGAQADFKKLLWQGSLGMASTMALSSTANYFLAMHFLKGLAPNSPEYNAAIGKIMGVGFLVIGIPMLLIMIPLFFWLMKRLSAITGLDSDELSTEGKTVRRSVCS